MKPTKTGFLFDDLVEIYIQRLCGLAYSRRWKVDMPTYAVYQDVMELFDGDKNTERGKEIAKRYKEKIIGKTCLTYAPSRYWQIGAVHDMGIEPDVWDSYHIHARAELMARRYIKNMVEVIDAAYKEEDDAKKRQLDKNRKDVPLEE